MSNSTLAIIVFLLGLAFAALVLDFWGQDTGPKALLGIIWTAGLLVALFYTNNNQQK